MSWLWSNFDLVWQLTLAHVWLSALPIVIGFVLSLPIGWVANRINPGLAHYAEIIDVLSKKLPAPLIGELPYLPRAEQRELSQYVDLDVLGNVMAIDRIPA